MMDGFTSVSLPNFKRIECQLDSVHAEPGEDSITFAREVADWILARIPKRPRHSTSAPEGQSKL